MPFEDGSGLASELEVVEGLQIDRGFLSPYFMNVPERQACVLEDAVVIICDQRLSSIEDLLPLLDEACKDSKSLLVIADDIDGNALATLVLNAARGVIKTCAIKAPGFGEWRKTGLQDNALVTGGKVLSQELGTPLAKAVPDDLGRVRKVEIDKDRTTLIGGTGNRTAITERVASLKKEREHETSEFARKQLDDRIARLSGGVAVIKVGAATETELKERKLRVEDAMHATRAAVEEGIVPGGGVALLRARKVLLGLTAARLEQDAGIKIVARAMEAPLRRIVANAGEEPSTVLHRVDNASERGFGYNAATGEYGDLIGMGVIDPAKVARLALQNAGSIASLILSTDCMIATALDDQEISRDLPAF